MIPFRNLESILNDIRQDFIVNFPEIDVTTLGSLEAAIVMAMASESSNVINRLKVAVNNFFPQTADIISNNIWAEYSGLTRREAQIGQKLDTIVGMFRRTNLNETTSISMVTAETDAHRLRDDLNLSETFLSSPDFTFKNIRTGTIYKLDSQLKIYNFQTLFDSVSIPAGQELILSATPDVGYVRAYAKISKNDPTFLSPLKLFEGISNKSKNDCWLWLADPNNLASKMAYYTSLSDLKIHNKETISFLKYVNPHDPDLAPLEYPSGISFLGGYAKISPLDPNIENDLLYTDILGLLYKGQLPTTLNNLQYYNHNFGVAFGDFSPEIPAETDAELFARIMSKRSSPIGNFNRYGIEQAALLVPGVTRVKVKPKYPDLGKVTVLFMRDFDIDPLPSETATNDVKTELLKIKEITMSSDNLIVTAPTSIPVNIRIIGLSVDSDVMRTSINSNLKTLFSQFKFEEDVMDELIEKTILDTIDIENGENLTYSAINIYRFGDPTDFTDSILVLGTITYA